MFANNDINFLNFVDINSLFRFLCGSKALCHYNKNYLLCTQEVCIYLQNSFVTTVKLQKGFILTIGPLHPNHEFVEYRDMTRKSLVWIVQRGTKMEKICR